MWSDAEAILWASRIDSDKVLDNGGRRSECLKITKAVMMILCRMLSTHVPCCHTAGFSGAEKIVSLMWVH